MKKISGFISFVIVLAMLFSSVSCSVKDGIVVPPEGCAIEFPSRDVYSYDMDLTLDTEDKTIGGHVDIEFYNDSPDTWNELCLRDYPSLFERDRSHGDNHGGGVTTIKNVTDSRTGGLDFRRDEDISVLWIDLDQPLKPGKKMTLSYDFTAVIPHFVDRFGYSYDGYNVTNFYPILAEYTDEGWSHRAFFDHGECFFSEISNYHVALHVPSGFIVAATGEEVSVSEDEDGLTYELEAPYVRDFVFCAGDHLIKETCVKEGVNINVFYNTGHTITGDMTDAVDRTMEVAGASLAAFNEAFGRYPYGELDIILEPIDAGAGMEYPNLVLIDDMLCASYMVNELENTIIHEIGHQWFMGIVGSDSAGEPWLDESFASYSELVYYEYLGGEKEEANTYEFSRGYWDLTDREEGSDDYIDLSYDEFLREYDGAYTMGVYYIGKMMLYQMEEAVGRDEFHSVIRAYVHRYAFTNATTSDFLEVLYAVAGSDNEDINALAEMYLRTRLS